MSPSLDEGKKAYGDDDRHIPRTVLSISAKRIVKVVVPAKETHAKAGNNMTTEGSQESANDDESSAGTL